MLSGTKGGELTIRAGVAVDYVSTDGGKAHLSMRFVQI